MRFFQHRWKTLLERVSLLVTVLILAVGAYAALTVFLTVADLPVAITRSDYHRYRYIAHLPGGDMLIDEKGHALLFDSRKAADDYAVEYGKEP